MQIESRLVCNLHVVTQFQQMLFVLLQYPQEILP
jgi:hypothetical protein